MRRSHPSRPLAVAALAAALAGCFVSPSGDQPNEGVDPSSTPGQDNPVVDDAAAPAQNGLPCGVEKILEAHCSSCHGANHTAPSRLVTYDDLTGPAVNDKSKTAAEEALARMESSSSPMPPSGPKPTSQELATFKAWVAASTPKGAACAGDAGAAADAGVHDAGNPYATPLVCTSKQTWSGGYNGAMHPGVSCNGCHSWKISGTVYPTAHEPDNCDGVGKVSVVVTDAHAKTVTLAVNSVGNFYTSTSLVAPFTVKVVSASGTRVMGTKAPNGNCNACHTVKGVNGAPGRIMAP